MNTIELLYIDLFCGAGGTSSGVEYATVKLQNDCNFYAAWLKHKLLKED